MPASAAPPSLVLKNLICVALGLPSVIVQATIVPLRRAARKLCAEPTLTWNPVVRLTARHGLVGQLGTVGGVVAGRTPNSVRVAGAPAGSARASASPPKIAAAVRLIRAIEHDFPVDVAVPTRVRRRSAPGRRPRSPADHPARASTATAADRPRSGE